MSPLAERLVGERLDDGGWNCERANGSLRSSFATTINVLEGLLEYERATGGTPDSVAARGTGEEFLLARGLFRRLRTGEPADEQFRRFVHPNRWRYDVLRALDYFHSSSVLTGAAPDPRFGTQSSTCARVASRTAPGRSTATSQAARGSPSTTARADLRAGSPCGLCESAAGARAHRHRRRCLSTVRGDRLARYCAAPGSVRTN